MKKFVIRSVISFLLIFIFVSGTAYLFYNHIVDGYISDEIADAVYVNSMSTRDIVNAQFKVIEKSFNSFYNGKENETLEELNDDIIKYGDFGDLEAEFGVIDSEKLVLSDKTLHGVNSNHDLQVLSDYINKEIYFLDFNELFENNTTENDIRIIFNVDYGKENLTVNKVGMISASKFLDGILITDRQYQPDTFIINKNGFINYKTIDDDEKTFWDYIRVNSSDDVVNDLIHFINDNKVMDLNKKDKFINDDCKFLNKQSYLSYFPLNVVANAPDDFYIVSAFYDESLVNLRQSLIIPLIIMFIVLSLILLAGTSILYVVALKKNADIEASRLAMYYSKPYIMKINKKGKIVYKNASFHKLRFDWKRYSNVYFFDIVSDEEIDILGAIKKRDSVTIQMTNEDGFTYTFFMVPVKIGLGLYILGQEVTRKYKEISSLIQEVTYDKLTSLPNKKILIDDLKSQLKFLNHEKTANKNIVNSSLIMFSIQRLERLSNIFGSATVDELVINFIAIVKEQMTDDHVLYRLDKDLFAVLFKRVEKYDDIIEWVNTLIEKLKKPINIYENQLMILIKCGIFNIELDAYDKLDEDDIYEYTEIAYNHANGLSSVDYMVYNISLGRLVKKEQLMEEDLKKAIDNNEFVVYVQPQYDTDKNKIVGFEALTRWNNPKYLTDSPQHFIEMAEKNNMIVPIGKIITDQAFAIAKQLEEYNIEISINVSPAQMMQDGFVNQFIATCEKHEVNPEMIALEITETFLVQNFKLVNEKLTILKRYGFKIHLDDFGTGYSSLLYLKDLPIDAIKIDKEFTKYVNTDKSTRVIVSKVISLATSLDLTIIAEGVEDEKQSIFLNKNGCKIIQGWLIGKAMPVANAIELLNEYNVKKTKGLDLDAKKSKTKKSTSKKEEVKEDKVSKENNDSKEKIQIKEKESMDNEKIEGKNLINKESKEKVAKKETSKVKESSKKTTKTSKKDKEGDKK